MRQSKQEDILLELMRQLDERENVDAGVVLRNPVEAYTSQELAREEWEEFFEKNRPNFLFFHPEFSKQN